MNRCSILAVLSILMLVGGLGGVALADCGKDHGEGHDHAQGEGGQDLPPDMMEAWMKIATPNEHHQHLAKLAGKWGAQGKMWMQPGADPTAMEGTAQNEMILGGRFLQSHYKGDFMGQSFVGIGIDGFDNSTGKHVGTWLDSAGTMMLNFIGDCREGGRVQTMVSEFKDVMTGGMAKMKGTVTVMNDDKYKYEAWMTGPDGEFFKTMEIVYTRQ